MPRKSNVVELHPRKPRRPQGRPAGRTVRNGADIPQHPLLSARQWHRLRSGAILRFTYWAETGPYASTDYDGYSTRIVKSHVVTRADCP